MVAPLRQTSQGIFLSNSKRTREAIRVGDRGLDSRRRKEGGKLAAADVQMETFVRIGGFGYC